MTQDPWATRIPRQPNCSPRYPAPQLSAQAHKSHPGIPDTILSAQDLLQALMTNIPGQLNFCQEFHTSTERRKTWSVWRHSKHIASRTYSRHLEIF